MNFWKRRKKGVSDDEFNPLVNRLLPYEPEYGIDEEDPDGTEDDSWTEDLEHDSSLDEGTTGTGDGIDDAENMILDGHEPEEKDDPEKGSPREKRKMFHLAVAAIWAMLLLIICHPWDQSQMENLEENKNTKQEEMVSITESGKEDIAEISAKSDEITPAEKKVGSVKTESVGTEAENKQEPEQETNAETEENVKPLESPEGTETHNVSVPMGNNQDWQETVFGSHAAGVVTFPISVKGLTENEKNLTGFRESDFIRELSTFLAANNLRSSSVTFTGSISCSADQAAAYTADLNGSSDWKLMVVFYPEYPGKYLFSLIRKEQTIRKEEPSAKSSETRQQVPASSVSGTVPASQAVQPQQLYYQEQPAPVQQRSTEETQDAYDAMELTIGNLPEELENYLSNSYELQYELYDFLFQRGIRNAKKASVTDYYIDAKDRSSSIQIRIEGVGTVTAIYDRDSNSYSFQ